MKPVFVVGGLYSLENGVAWIMRDLAAALGRAGAPVTVCAADCYGRGLASVGHVFEPPSRWVSAKGLWLGGLSWCPALKPKLREEIAQADVIHNHSLWMLPNSYSSRTARRSRKPVVITAHGALEPWAIQHSGWKKRVVGRLFQNLDLQRADCVHVNTAAEARGIREYGLSCPIAVIANGVHPPDFENLPPRDALDRQSPEARGKRLMLYLARLHQKKGLGHLLPAWSRLAADHEDWHLMIAGPDRGFEATAKRLAVDLRIGDRVTFTGPVQGVEKRALLGAAEIFVQPSFSEGFSMSLLEALTCRLPVLLTPGCNFREAVDVGAAIEVEPTVESTTDGLASLLRLDDAELRRMGEQGRALVLSRYTWDCAAAQTLELYSWLTGCGKRPDSIFLDA